VALERMLAINAGATARHPTLVENAKDESTLIGTNLHESD
jgi:hypothetical protein